jgi:large subunit ribosomal protein LP0
MASKKAKNRKFELAEELESHFDEYSKLFLVTVDNVGSNQLHEIRKNLRGHAIIYCGKNTQMRRVVRKLAADRPELEALVPKLKLNVALVFTHCDLSDIKDKIEENKMPAAAKAGALAQVDLTIEKGVTSLEPSQTSFLQALNIGTKITKGQIEIINDTPLLKAGVRVDASQAALLQKLNILPFAYGLIVVGVYDNGSVFEPDVLSISNDDILRGFNAGVRNIAAMSIALNTPTTVSVPYLVLLGFRNMLAIACATEHTFKGAEKVKAYLADPSAFAFASGPATSAAAAPAAAAKKKTTTEEEDMAPATGLFDGGDDY